MKYWIFQNNQVNGPHDAEDLARQPAFSAEALVCPEGRKGTSMGDWQRAGMLPELSVALLKASQLAAAGAGASRGGGGQGLLPPEPTLRDLAALGSLQEKVALLEGALAELQDGLRRKDSELLNLHRELEEKKRAEAELVSKLGGLEERLNAVSKIRESLDETIAAEKGVEGSVERQRQTMEELARGLEALREERAHLRKSLEESIVAEKIVEGVVERQRQALEGLTRALESLKEERAQDREKWAELEKAQVAGKEPPRPVVEAPAPFVPTPAPMAAVESVPLPEIKEEPKISAAPPPVSEIEEAVVAPAPAPKSKKGLLIASTVFILIAGGLAALQFGLIGGGEKAAPPMEEPAPVETVTPAPEAVPAEVQLEELKQQAISLVRMWPSGDGVKTVGQRLEGDVSQSGLSPWMAEKLAEGLFQVNFYAKSVGPGGGTIHEFQVRSAEKQVSALNLAAKAVLEKELPPPPPPAKPRRVKVRPKAKAPEAAQEKTPAADAGLLDDLLKP
jgi:hypothetical protein